MNILRVVISGLAFATWNPFKYLIGTDEVKAKEESAYTAMDWIKIGLLILLPLGSVAFFLNYFGIINIFGKKKTYKRRRAAVSRRSARRPAKRRVSGTARSKQLRALAKGRATRARNLRAKRKK
jgi:hypothetical protein